MKKKLLFVGLAVILTALSSCRKEDQYLLEKGFRVEGTVNPGFEVPVSSGQVNFGELLDKFGDQISDYITDDELITLRYSFENESSIDIGGALSSPAPKKRKAGIPTKDQVFTPMEDTVFSYEFPLSFFDNVDMLEESDIEINHLFLDGYAKVWAECPPNVVPDLEYIRADIDQLKIDYKKHNGQPGNTIVVDGAELHITDLSDTSNTMTISTDLADIFNDMPSYISISFHIVISVDQEGFVTSNLSNVKSFSELLDSLGMTRLVYHTHIDATIPLELRIGAMSYNYDIDLQQEGADGSVFDQIDSILNSTLGEGAANIDSAALAVIFKFDNGIPLDITLNAFALNELELPIFTLIQGETIHSAETAPMPGNPGVSEAVASTQSKMMAELNLAQARQFLSASKLRLHLGLKTTGNDNKAIRRSDYLGIKMYIRINPNIEIQWDIPGLENGLGGLIH